MPYQNRNQKPSEGIKFADLLLVLSISISYLNYQQNAKQAETQKDIAKNLKTINEVGIVQRLLEHIENN